ncbi:MAG: PHP domain-containing protein [Candidatus Dormiibacterota bacterium]
MTPKLGAEVPETTTTPERNFDSHVHSEWSWDAAEGSMLATCRRAMDLGWKGLAFTEHSDHTPVSGAAQLDVAGYFTSLERCRSLFPSLDIRSGVELGEPHRFPAESTALLTAAPFDLVLGSVHCVPIGGELVDLSRLGRDLRLTAEFVVQSYLSEVMALIAGPVPFAVLAHLEYFKRYWPSHWAPYRASDHEEHIRSLLSATLDRGTVLEVNTSAGLATERGLCPGPELLRWWRELGGREVSLGSDAHSPDRLGAGFPEALELLSRLGLRVARGHFRAGRASTTAHRNAPRG